MKLLWYSKTFWVGALSVFLSVATMILDTWALLSPDEQLLLRDLFGPTAFGILGVVMIILRVVTTSAVSWLPQEEEAE